MTKTKTGNNEAMGVPRKLMQTLNMRLHEEGWRNVSAFRKGTGLPFTLETVRRAFYDCDYKNLETITLAIIMKHLNYSPNEIKTILKKHLGPEDPVLELIGDAPVNKLSTSETKMLAAYRAIVSEQPELSNSLADHLDLLGRIANVATKQNTDALRR